ncbi:DNA-binding transcriptional regulator [Pirellulales bacterium]|nr:DNA-binding transcriptional regulator [Pirellulales bacterium]MDC1301619.1 DNA-binding transcriptional regulator [bacterium]
MKRSVALVIETSNEYARGLLRGILRYQQEHEKWTIDLPEQHRGADPPRWLRTYSGHGIIARIETKSIARAVRATQLPAVDVSSAREVPNIPWVETDDTKIAQLAVRHFLEKGFRHLAFCGESSFNWSSWRRDAFVAEAKQAGINPLVFDVDDDSSGTTWPHARRRLMRWIAELPEPCGLMAAYDSLARRLVDLCVQVSRPVPESVAILGVDDDPLLCQLATPPLSSVIPDSEGAGYAAAEQLDAIMSGKKIQRLKTLLPPLGIATRQSTDTLAVDDQNISKAAHYILAHACDGIQVGDVVEQTKLTRRTLETRFKKVLNKTPHELITITRLSKAERLLRETTLTLDQIAARCGLEYSEYLSVLFRKHRNMTPGEYRQQHRQ